MADDNAAAADFEIPGVDNRELANYIRSELEFDQLILEFIVITNRHRAGYIVVIQQITIETNPYVHKDGQKVHTHRGRIGELTSQIVTGKCPSVRQIQYL